MSIQTEIDRINTSVTAAYAVLEGLGADMPAEENVDNLAATAATLSTQGGAGFRPNLLDNWYFGRPVNQRGKTSYTATGYTVDRWAASSGSVTVAVGTDSIEVSVSSGTWQNINQAIEFPSRLNGQTVTLSVWIESGHNVVLSLKNATTNAKYEKTIASPSGVISLTFDIAEDFAQDSDTVRFYVFITQGTSEDASATLKAVKLELGDTQTLAHQDADGGWVLNEIPNYAEQLARCQRFYYRFGTRGTYAMPFGYGRSSSATAARALIPLPVAMRDIPTLTADSNIEFTIASDGMSATLGTVPTPFELNASGLTVGITSSGMTSVRPVILTFRSKSSSGKYYIELSADL